MMKEKKADEATKGMLVGEARKRIQSLLTRYRNAQQELRDVSRLLHSWIAIYEDESGKQFPEEILSEAGVPLMRPVRLATTPVSIGRVPSVPEVVFEVMRGADEPLHLNTIAEKVLSKGYDLGVKKPKERIRIALIRGVTRGIYERTVPNTFKINPTVRNKRYQEL